MIKQIRHKTRQPERIFDKIPRTILFILIFAVIGIILLIASKAAAPFVSIELESASVAIPASVQTDSSASGGQYVKFGPGLPPLQGRVKVMALGDSITDGYNVPGGYRIDLKAHLNWNGYDTDFVGSLANGPDGFPDPEHEGHSGWEIDQIAGSIESWLSTYQPQVILLQIGTNDMIRNIDVANAPSRLTSLIDWINFNAPNTRLIVSSIPPMSDPTYNDRAIAYNATIPDIVASRDRSKVFYVDIYNSITTADLVDGFHPSREGYGKMALIWYYELIKHLESN